LFSSAAIISLPSAVGSSADLFALLWLWPREILAEIAISVFRVGLHGVVEQYRISALSTVSANGVRRPMLKTEDSLSHPRPPPVNQDVLFRSVDVAHADGRAVGFGIDPSPLAWNSR